MARINLSIPDDVKEQMDSFTSENWSKVALEAFNTRIKILKLMEVDMDAAGLERLRSSKAQNSEREHADGYRQGKDWALNVASFDELERVVALAGADWTNDIWIADLATAIVGYPEDDGPQAGRTEACIASLSKAFGPNHGYYEDYRPTISSARATGFVEGAGEVFNAV